jgi:DNA recombination-dependent growth factor C
MVCEQKIKELERQLGRRLTKEEKKRVQEKMHHNESYEHPVEEEAIAC